MEPYCGSDTQLPSFGMGQGPDVVLGLCDKAAVIEGTLLYFDNLFSSMPLMDALSERGKLHDT